MPAAGLPAASRSAGVSRPWSSALRTRCTSGSPIASTTVRSSSVSWPTSSSSTCLPSLVERSRTSRGKRRKTASTGIMRTCMTIACRACEQRVRSAMACERPGTSAWAARTSTWVRWTTSSPMRCISWSRRSASTRTVAATRPPSPRSPATTGIGTGAAGSASATTPASATSATSAVATSGTAVRAALSAAASTPGGDPHVHAAPVEGLDVVLLRSGGDDGAQVGGGGDDHVGAHRRHQGVVGQRDPGVQHGVARADRLDDGRRHRRGRRAAVARDLLVGGAVADEALQALDERRGLQVLDAVGLDGVGGALERVEALEQRRRRSRAPGRPSAGAAARRRPPSGG